MNVIVRRMRAQKRALAIGIWETQAGHLGFVLKGIKSKRKGRHIEDGHQYVGAFPADMWRKATGDRQYKTLSHAIKTFPERWTILKREITEPMHFISIGPGTGEKDKAVLRHLQQLAKERGGPPIVYLPVDISGDLLKMSFDVSMDGIDEQFVELVWMEMDATTKEAIRTINTLRSGFPDGPALVSILGNTLANFSDDRVMLNHLAGLLSQPNDLLLVELATTPEVSSELAEVAEEEYEGSTSFRDFVMASLSQYTDCIPSSGEVGFEAHVNSGRVEVTTVFTSEKKLRVNLMDGDSFELQPKERIKLYTSRKYTDEALAVLTDGFLELEEGRTSYGDNSGFGVVTKLLKPTVHPDGITKNFSRHPATL